MAHLETAGMGGTERELVLEERPEVVREPVVETRVLEVMECRRDGAAAERVVARRTRPCSR